MAEVIYSGERLIDGTGAKPLQSPYVVVEAGRIAQIGSGEPPEDLAAGVQRCHFAGATLIPGLIDAHVHLALGLSESDGVRADNDPLRLSYLAARAAREALRVGVTTVADCGARDGVTLRLRDAIARGDVPGARIWACGTWLTVTNGHGYFWTEWGLDNADELRKGVRQMVWEGADFIKIMASGGTTQGERTNRRRAQYSVAELRAAVEDAHRLNKRVHCHANAAEALRHCIEAGVDVVEHCNWLGIQDGTIDYDEESVRLGARKGIYAGINTGGIFGPLNARDGCAQEWGDLTRWDLMRRMQTAGMSIFINTDATANQIAELPRVMARMVAEGKADALETLQMATLVPAQALGLGDTLGSVEVGKWADMVILSDDPLSDMSAVTRPGAVIKEGRIVVRDGVVLS